MSSRQASKHRSSSPPDVLARWRPWFWVALFAVGGAAVVFVIVIANVASDGGNGNSGNFPVVPTNTPTATSTTASPDPTSTQPGGGEPTETPPTGEPTTPPTQGRQLVCGDIMAPLNKLNYLAADCEPNDLVAIPGARTAVGTQYMRSFAAEALLELMDAASADGYDLYAVSGYRSYQAQVSAYESNRAACGGSYECADRVSARPGHSEHQLGTTMDVSSPSAGFGLESFRGTAEADWVEANAWRFGFVVSYPAGTEHITGYDYEPWHIRWIGKVEAQRVHESGLTLHEYLAR